MDVATREQLSSNMEPPDYRTEPSQYKHWRLSFDGLVATLTMDVAEDGGIRPGYKLKLNSYDLGVDIELHDALQRIRFEHPEIRSVITHEREEPHFLFGCEHLHAGTFLACVESQLLQVHERNAKRN